MVQVDQEVQEQPEAEVEAAPAAEATPEGEAEKVKRGSPTYAVHAVDELPAKTHGGGLNIRNRAHIYTPLLAQVIQQPGQWFELAKYTSLTGARTSAKSVGESIASGEIPVAGGEFQFDTRRRVAGVDAEGNEVVIPSVLYAKFNVADGGEAQAS